MGSIYTVVLPDIGEGVVEGEVIEWLKKVGDLVKQDEPVVVVMTDKATVELPSPYPGTLVKQYYKPGQIAFKDKPLYDIDREATKATSEETVQKVLASPATRRKAQEMGVDIQKVKGTGKEGRVTDEDLGQASLPPEEEARPIIGIRKLMAQSMAESKAKIPHFSFFEQADATRLIQLVKKIKEEGAKEEIHVTFMPFFIRALSLTIKRHPELNSSYDSESSQLIIHKHQNLGIATSTALGLIVPVIKNVESMSLEELIRQYDALREKVKNNQLQSSDMKEGTITLSNYGSKSSGLWATPIIKFPEVAILALARIQKQPLVKNDQVIARDVLNLSWSFDHRIFDGNTASLVSHTFMELIQNPAQLC